MIQNRDYRSRACLTDWDGTLRPGFMVADWLSYLSRELGVPATYYDHLTRLLEDHRVGIRTYEQFASEAIATYARALRGLKCKDVDDASAVFVHSDMSNLFPFAIGLLEEISDAGFSIHVLTGGPLRPLLAYARKLPISSIFAVDVECTSDGVFGSKIIKNYALKDNKEDAVRCLKSKGFEIALAFGDTESDTPLLEAANYSFVLSEGAATPPSIGIIG